MSNQIQSINPESLISVHGGQMRGQMRRTRPEADGVSPLDIPGGSINAPVFGRRGPLSAGQSRRANAADAARRVSNGTLGRGSNSGAVESRQWRSMVDGIEDD